MRGHLMLQEKEYSLSTAAWQHHHGAGPAAALEVPNKYTDDGLMTHVLVLPPYIVLTR